MVRAAHCFSRELADPRRYEEQIEHLRGKRAQAGTLHLPGPAGLSFASISMHRRQFSRILADAVSTGEYRLSPARRRIAATNNGKIRLLYVLTDEDQIVHGVVARILTDKIKSSLSPALLSYQRGLTWLDGVSRLAAYFRRHYKRHTANPLDRGMFVVRHDIREYTDTIPVGRDAPIWDLLTSALASIDSRPIHPSHWQLLEQVVRPVVVADDGAQYSNTAGIPTGSPITAVLYNLCAAPVDRALDKQDGAFYARYSDDILFAHPDPQVVVQADRAIVAQLARLGLAVNSDKAGMLYVTVPGRRHDDVPAAKPARAVDFLGCSVALRGTVSLKKKRTRLLLADLRERARRTFRFVAGADRDTAGLAVCGAVNAALDPTSAFANKFARFLASAHTDREQLRHLDYLIARLVARTLTRTSAVRAFRQCSYQRLRRQYGLLSLYHRRNRDRYSVGRRVNLPARQSTTLAGSV